MATNYVNNQKVSTKSRADETNNTLLGGATPTPGTNTISTLKLSELKARAAATIKSLKNMLMTPSLLSNSKQLEDAQDRIVLNVSSAEIAFATVKDESVTLGDLVTVKKKSLTDDLTAALTEVSKKETLLDDAKFKLYRAQEDRDTVEKVLQEKKDELNKKLSAANAQKELVDAKLVVMNSVIDELLKTNTSSDPNNDDTLNGLRAAKDISDTQKYIEALGGLRGEVSGTVIFTFDQQYSYSKNLDELVALQAEYALVKVTPVELSAMNGAISSMEIDLAQSKQSLDKAKIEESNVLYELRKENDRKDVIDKMNQSIKAFETTLKAFSGGLSENSALPAQLSRLVLPNPDYGVDTKAISEVNAEVDKVNGTLLKASKSFESLDKAIADANKNKGDQKQSYETYCSDLQKKYFPNDPVDGEDAIVPLALDGTDSWAQIYYDGTNPLGLGNCKQYENKPAWNGQWGADARCYTATGMCKRGKLCNTVKCLTRIDDVVACINKEVDISKCTNASPPTAPADVLQAGFSCPPSGVKNYFERGGKLYLANGKMFTQGTKKFCVNKEIAETDVNTITEARDFIAHASKKNYGFCIPLEDYVWDGATYEYSTTAASGVPATKKSLKKFRTCYAKNVNSLTNVACDTSTMVDDQYCQCTEQGYTFNNGKTSCPFFNVK